ncbi:hypothetical protein RBH29_08655 [Herbivorax sp. ANBcel31]|nr:hypothetical protein [Herbivorax sp. ANBcel31]MDQ2086496.1 hypothetical protein [Herbivorax sp. ANBcel31]
MFALVDAFQRAEREFSSSGDNPDSFKKLRKYIARKSNKTGQEG